MDLGNPCHDQYQSYHDRNKCHIGQVGSSSSSSSSLSSGASEIAIAGGVGACIVVKSSEVVFLRSFGNGSGSAWTTTTRTFSAPVGRRDQGFRPER